MDSAKIFIDTDNEITFVLEKILAAKPDRVCLIVPDRASLFTSVSGLKLIKRVIDKSPKHLVLVTLDPNGADLATKSGLIVVSRVGEITPALWEKAEKSKFEFVKKHKNRVYYQPDKPVENTVVETKPEKISIKDLINANLEEGVSDEESSNFNLQTTMEDEIVNDNSDENLQSSISNIPSPETYLTNQNDEHEVDFNDIPQVRIRVDEEEVQDAKESEIEEQNQEELKEAQVNLANLSENVKKSPTRMRRKITDNPSSLSFTPGKDINLQKKK